MRPSHDLKELLQALPCRQLAGPPPDQRQATGVFAGDMLSWVMAHASAGDIWLTILNSVNVLAVAALTECACVLLTEQVGLDEATLERAEQQGILVFSTPLSTAEVAWRLLQAWPLDRA